MKLLIQRKKNTEISFSERDYAISAYALQENITILKRFVRENGFIPLTDEAYGQLMSSGEAKEVTKNYILLKNKMIFFIDNLDWKALNIIYSVYNAFNRKEALQCVLDYNFNISTSFGVLTAKYREIIKEIDNTRNEFSKSIKFFNLNKFMQICSNEGIDAESTPSGIFLKFKDIQLDYIDGSIIYDKIIVCVKDLMIDGYVLEFSNFSYSSYWNLPFKLHSFLDIPYGKNNYLAFLPQNDYITFVRELKSAILSTADNSDNIVSTYLDLQKLWGIYKDEYKDNIQLSKRINNEKAEILKNKDL
jgi:hypothetical protein